MKPDDSIMKLRVSITLPDDFVFMPDDSFNESRDFMTEPDDLITKLRISITLLDDFVFMRNDSFNESRNFVTKPRDSITKLHVFIAEPDDFMNKPRVSVKKTCGNDASSIVSVH